MPPELDRCVQKLKDKGYSEDEAWAICRKQLGYDLSMKREKAKRIFTGQLINDKYIFRKAKEFKKEFQIKE